MRALHATTALTLTLSCLACAGRPQPSTRPAVRARIEVRLPWAAAGLSRQEAAAHLLSRFSFGARPGEVARVAALGPDRWLEEQLQADLPEAGLGARLASYPALAMPEGQILRTYPNDGMVRSEAKKAGVIPSDNIFADNRAPLHAPSMSWLRWIPRTGDWLREAPEGARPQEPTEPGPSIFERVALGAPLAAPPDPGAEREKEIRALLGPYAKSRGYHPQRELLDQLAAQKLLRAVYAENQLSEVMTDFWFNHFNVSQTNDRTRPYLLSYERDAIRPFALGRFRRLLEATARHPAMLLYLDNAQSVAPGGTPTTFGDEMALAKAAAAKPAAKSAANPPAKLAAMPAPKLSPKPSPQPAPKSPGLNENYAREIMELHTLGVDGGYTQEDVVEVARAFTGWTVVPDENALGKIEQKMAQEEKIGGHAFFKSGEFLFRADTHDASPKRVLGHLLPGGRGIEDGEAVLDLLAVHPSTAHHLATQLAVRFVSDHPSPELVERLARVYTATGGDIRRVIAAVAESPEFWRPEARGAKIKSPFELAASALRALGADVTEPKPVLDWVARIGEPLYAYQAPTGYPDRAEAWVNTGALLSRMNFGLQLASGKVKGVKVDPAALAELAHGSARAAILLPLPAAPPKKGGPTPDQEVAGLLLGSPAFQRR
jgi:uncharacterized protein (DUF1800 family)